MEKENTFESNLEELKVEVNKLQSLLKENQVGLFTWWGFLVDRLNKINEISKKLGMIE